MPIVLLSWDLDHGNPPRLRHVSKRRPHLHPHDDSVPLVPGRGRGSLLRPSEETPLHRLIPLESPAGEHHPTASTDNLSLTLTFHLDSRDPSPFHHKTLGADSAGELDPFVKASL